MAQSTPQGAVSYTHTYGGVDTVVRPNGVVTDHDYDPAGRLTTITHTGPVGLIDRFDYELDANGNRTGVSGTRGTETYTVDSLDRLVEVTYPNGDTTSYAYNAAGDRTEMVATPDGGVGEVTVYNYDDAGQLESVTDPTGVVDYTFDDRGNLIADSTGAGYTWDSTGMMATATIEGDTETYTYDAAGNRVAVDGQRWLWDTQGGLSQLLDDGATTHTPGLASSTAGGDVWHLTDALGSIRTETDPAGTPTAAIDYDAYGATRTGTTATPLGYTGQHTDPTGLIHLRARPYNPVAGQFASPDPVQPNIGGSQGFSLYTYAGSNPSTRIDPR